jgi:hypothetical protein
MPGGAGKMMRQMNHPLSLSMMSTDKKILFIRASFWIGVAADLLASLPLLFPRLAGLMFGLQNIPSGNEYLYASRIGASLMLGWTCLLAWGSHKPIERKGILLLTVVPVLAGLFVASVLAVQSEFIQAVYMVPLWVFYTLIIPLYLIAYFMAVGIEKKRPTT